MAQKVEYSSYGSRLMQSIKGVLAGVVFFVASFVLLFWNEGRAVRTAKGLEEGRKACVEAALERLDPATDGKLVHVSGPAATEAVLRDPQFGVALNALRLERTVKMFQWVESERTRKEKQLGGGEKTITTYTYAKAWDDTWHDPSEFYEKQSPPNPRMPFSSKSWNADRVTLGVYTLPAGMVQTLRADEELPMSEDPAVAQARPCRVVDGSYFLGGDPGDPQIGDLQVSYRVLKPSTVSLLARRQGVTFEPYVTAEGTTISVIETGTHSAAGLFDQEVRANTILTWGLRLGGFLAMALGIGLVLKPVATLGDVVPIIGTVLGAGIGMVAFLAALVLTCVTIGLAWLAYRPLLGGSLLGIAAAVLVVGILRRRRVQPSAFSAT